MPMGVATSKSKLGNDAEQGDASSEDKEMSFLCQPLGVQMCGGLHSGVRFIAPACRCGFLVQVKANFELRLGLSENIFHYALLLTCLIGNGLFMGTVDRLAFAPLS